jgi:hypothetical protein
MSIKLFIPGGRDPHNGIFRSRFVIGDEHTAYEWAMIYADRHPAPWETSGGTIADMKHRETWLGARGGGNSRRPRRHKIAGEVYHELVEEIRAGRITPRKRVYCTDQPSEPDPTQFVIAACDVLNLAKRRNDGGWYIKKMKAAADNAGRPLFPPTKLAEVQCERWLRGLGAVELAKQPKAEWRKIARERGGRLSARGFDRAWDRLAADHPELRRPGRKPKMDTR